jgi:hypothetical protein
MKAGPDSAPALRLCGLSKSFGEVRAVDGLSLDVTRRFRQSSRPLCGSL